MTETRGGYNCIWSAHTKPLIVQYIIKILCLDTISLRHTIVLL